jgi:D-alanine-D-alanine ligase
MLPAAAAEARVKAALERRAPTLRIAVIYGGDAAANGAVLTRTHNPRAWKSYQAVAEDIAAALRTLGIGAVELFADDMRLAERLRGFGPDLAWLNTGGVQGRSPLAHAPALLELLGLPYVGLDPLNAATLDAKHVFKWQLLGAGLPTAPFAVWDPAAGPFDIVADDVTRLTTGHDGAFCLKPVSGRASLHVEIADRAADIVEQAHAVASASGNAVLIEPFLPGNEYCVSVAGPMVAAGGVLRRLPGAFAFSAVERVLQPGERIVPSMDRKPITDKSYRLLGDADEGTRLELVRLAEGVRRVFGLDAVVRLDVRRDARGRLMILEANPKPDLKRPSPSVTSLVCAELPALGMSYEDLILSLLADRLDHYLHVAPHTAPRLAGHLQ